MSHSIREVNLSLFTQSLKHARQGQQLWHVGVNGQPAVVSQLEKKAQGVAGYMGFLFLTS